MTRKKVEYEGFALRIPKEINTKLDILIEEMDTYRSKNNFIVEILKRRVEDYGL